ncbi:MAG: hypothetical protein ACUVRK_10555 [Spirochaetota bacterium]
MGHIYIDRGDSHQARESLQAAGEKIRNGASVVFSQKGRAVRMANFSHSKKVVLSLP